MGSKSFRIKTTIGDGDKYLKVKLEQEVELVEILSLKISQKDLYASFNADFGVLVGRVIANGGVGIPNVKISIFIPISDDDKANGNVLSIYPYTSPRDKNADGVRYNLLPRVAVNNPFLVEGEYAPSVPVGTFPTKEELTANETFLEVFEKYYKYTTITNMSGDYMIYGVPIGNQTVHMSVDITDIGKYSMTPGTMINQLGYSPSLFTNNGTKVKFTTDLEILPNVETQEIAVDVKPFWGDSENFEIGITRQDFKIRALLTTAFTIFGSAFTDAFQATWGQNDIQAGDDLEEMWRINNEAPDNISVSSKRIGKINLDVFYINPNISDADTDLGNFDTKKDIIKLDQTSYTQYLRDGDFVITVPCNRKKIITDEMGNEFIVPNDSTNGVFTEFKGMILTRYGDELPTPNYENISGGLFGNHTFYGQRWKMKIPQNDPNGKTLNNSTTGPNEVYNETWRKEHMTFTASKIYSIAKYHHLQYFDGGPFTESGKTGFDPFWNTGIMAVDNTYSPNNSDFQFPDNGLDNFSAKMFGAEWINFTLHFPQHTYFIRTNNNDTHGNGNPTLNQTSRHFYTDNTQKVVGSEINTKNYLRGDKHKTEFIEVPKEDIINIFNNGLNPDGSPKKGFKSTDSIFLTTPLIGTYKKTASESKYYFYRGIGSSDCIQYLIDNSIVNP